MSDVDQKHREAASLVVMDGLPDDVRTFVCLLGSVTERVAQELAEREDAHRFTARALSDRIAELEQALHEAYLANERLSEARLDAAIVVEPA